MFKKNKIRILLTALLFSVVLYAQETRPTKIFLIRHTETLDDGSRDPELSVKGMERARKWALVLEHEKIDAVYSTDLKRTRALARIIAESQGIDKIIIYPRNINAGTFLNEIAGKTIVVSGHSNTTPELVNAILGREQFKQIDDADYSSLFMIIINSGSKPVVTLLKIG